MGGDRRRASEICTCCGQRVRVHKDDEGTGSYIGVDAEEAKSLMAVLTSIVGWWETGKLLSAGRADLEKAQAMIGGPKETSSA